MKNLKELTKKEMNQTNGGSLIGFIVGFVGACAVYVADREKSLNLPGGQAMKQ